jgi:GNAT superfamily N-acetyltransferase
MKFSLADFDIDVRPGTLDDIPQLLTFIRQMAEFEKLEVPTTETILKESLFGDRPAASFFLVYVDDQPVAYVTYFFTFSSMVGKRGLWLDDLFVIPEFRRRGIAKALMPYIADIAKQNDCGRFEWIVLDWNQNAIEFYKKLGAEILPEWHLCRLDEEILTRVAKDLPRSDQS